MPNQIMQIYTNQRIVKIYKAVCDKNHLYTTNNLQALDNAMGKLTSIGGVKLWMYLAKNQNYHIRALSSKDFCEWANCSIKSYNTGFKELVDNGFLVPEEEGSKYEFREWGRAGISTNNVKEEKKKEAGEGFDF